MNGKNGVKENRKKGKSLDVKDYVVRGIKPFLLFFMVIIISILLTIAGLLVQSFVLMQIGSIIMWVGLAYVFYITYKFHKRARRLSFINYRKLTRFVVLVLSIYFVGLFLLMFLRTTMDLPSGYFMICIEGLIIALLLPINLMRKLNSGSVVEWYNNIVVRQGREISETEDGYTERPYTMRLFESSETQNWLPKLEAYRKYMLDKVLIAGHERINNGYNLYLPSPTLQSGVLGARRDLEHTSRLTVYDDGSISVHISKFDYERIGLDVTYHELCQRILRSFASSIRAFMRGGEEEAVEILGGKGYTEKRRKFVRQTTLSYLRIGVVLMISVFIIFVGVFQQNIATLDVDFTNANDYGSPRDTLDFEVEAFEFNMGLSFGRDLRAGDQMTASFTVNATIPKAYIGHSGENGFEYEAVILENVSSGEFRFTAEESDYFYLYLVFENETGHIVPATGHVKVEHLNGYSTMNLVLSMILISIYVPIEVMLWRKREGVA